MKTKLVKRHYCEHCGKGGQSPYCMRRHESTCIYNPIRLCPACSEQHLDGSLLPTKETVARLISVLRHGGLATLRSVASGCPACMLSAIVQSREVEKPNEDNWVSDFNYKKEMTDWNTEKLSFHF